MTWINILQEAIGDFECANPGFEEKLKELTEDNMWEEEHPHAELFRDAACVVVEPNAYLGRQDEATDEAMEIYYEKCEEDMGFIKGVTGDMDNSEIWNHVIDVVSVTGY